MVIKNRSVLTRELEKKMSHIIFWKQQLKNIIILELICAAAIALDLLVYIDYWWISILLAIVMVGYPVLCVVLLNSIDKKSDAGVQFKTVEMDYTLHEAVMDVVIIDGGVSAPTIYQAYNDCEGIFNTKDAIILMVANHEAYFVEKKGFATKEDCEAFINVLKGLPQYRNYSR